MRPSPKALWPTPPPLDPASDAKSYWSISSVPIAEMGRKSKNLSTKLRMSVLLCAVLRMIGGYSRARQCRDHAVEVSDCMVDDVRHRDERRYQRKDYRSGNIARFGGGRGVCSPEPFGCLVGTSGDCDPSSRRGTRSRRPRAGDRARGSEDFCAPHRSSLRAEAGRDLRSARSDAPGFFLATGSP